MIYHGKQGTCWHPHFKAYVQRENSIYNNWRFEHVWLDKQYAASTTVTSLGFRRRIGGGIGSRRAHTRE